MDDASASPDSIRSEEEDEDVDDESAVAPGVVLSPVDASLSADPTGRSVHAIPAKSAAIARLFIQRRSTAMRLAEGHLSLNALVSSSPTMAGKRKVPKASDIPVEKRLDAVLAWMKKSAKKSVRDGMARYAIPSDRAFGISIGDLRKYAKALGRDHALAQALWDTEHYEARLLATFIDDATAVTAAQMERWCKAFDSWAIADTACFHLFARTPHAWAKVERWAVRKDEFVKRAAFALLASLVLHDKQATEAAFVRGLELVENAASDERNFVKKAVNWALRTVGKRNAALNKEAIAVAKRLAARDDAASRWVGKDALRELTSPAVAKRLAGKRRAK